MVDASSVNEFAPLIIRTEDVPVAPPIVSLLKDKPPPKKFLVFIAVDVSKMSAVSLLNVRFVVVEVFQTSRLAPLSVHNPEPIVKVLTLALLELRPYNETL